MSKLRNGNKQAHGGVRSGAGRKPDWLKLKCQDLIDKHKLLDFVARVAAGEETEERATKDGDVVSVGVSVHDRLHAFEILTERGFGKPVQGVELSGEVGGGAFQRFNLIIHGATPEEMIANGANGNGSNGNGHH